MAFDGTQACLPVRPAEILPAAKVSFRASLSDATDAVSDIMSALPVAAGFKPAGRTGRRPVFREVIVAGVDCLRLGFLRICFEEAGVTDTGYSSAGKVRFGETPKPTRETRVLPRRNACDRRSWNTGMFACAPSGDSPRCKG